MGYGTRNNGQIQTFWPEDTEKDIYIACTGYGITLETLLNTIKDKWPNAKPEEITIEAENIHTDCLTYDLHDSGDYTEFLHISLDRK